jgi:hypothetical protein
MVTSQAEGRNLERLVPAGGEKCSFVWWRGEVGLRGTRDLVAGLGHLRDETLALIWRCADADADSFGVAILRAI